MVRQLRRGKFVVGMEIQHLEKILASRSRDTVRLSLAIVIASLILGSSLVLSFKVSPQILGISLPGLAGLMTALFLGLVFFTRPRS